MTVRITPLLDAGDRDRLVWLATAEDGRPLGTASLRDNDVRVDVHPAERRAGVGTRLFAAVAEAARGRGLTDVLSDAIRQDSDGERFCLALGLRPALTLLFTRLPLDGPMPRIDAVWGLLLVHWEGAVPDELAETFARSRRAMDDMPMGEAGFTPRPWDVERLHRIAAAVAERGEILLTTAATNGDGEIVGFTELVVPGDGTGDAQHYGTGVVPELRGHGLARWMKAEQIDRVRERFPSLGGLLADTAEDNAAMRRINDTLGYLPLYRSTLYKGSLVGGLEFGEG